MLTTVPVAAAIVARICSVPSAFFLLTTKSKPDTVCVTLASKETLSVVTVAEASGCLIVIVCVPWPDRLTEKSTGAETVPSAAVAVTV